MERKDTVNENITLNQNTDGLCYGTDALLLSAFLRPKARGKAAEFGAGTGIISLLAAKRNKYSKIYAFEVQEQYAELCSRNVAENGKENVITTLHADIREVKSELTGGELDAVYCNPPYMRTDTGTRNENDGKYIARHEVCGGIGDFCSAAKRLLKHGGRFYAVYRPDRLTDLICAMRENKLEPKRMTMVYNDPSYPPCLVLIEGRKGGGEGLFVTKPLFIKDAGEDSREIRYMYENGEFSDGYRKE
ncbi:MAG: methyltransferase [Clostridia bacterium]|nr:methyltransferase [Clostridia bacterium]